MVDITNKSILIIKSKSSTQMATESYLVSKGWTVFSTTRLKEAILHLVNSKPAFVLISVNFPNKNITKLPKIFARTFKVTVVAFAENNLPQSIRSLNNVGAEYVLYPPMSGPAVERLLNKHNEEGDLRPKDEVKIKNKSKYEFNIKIKGKNKNMTGVVTGPEEDDEMSAEQEAVDLGDEMSATQEGVDQDDELSAEQEGAEPDDETSGVNPGARRRPKAKKSSLGRVRRTDDSNPDDDSADDEKEDPDEDSVDGLEDILKMLKDGEPEEDSNSEDGPTGEVSDENEANDEDDGYVSKFGRKKKVPTYSTPARNPNRNKHHPKMYDDTDDSGHVRVGKESLIIRGTREALDKVVVREKGKPIGERVEISSNVACIMVDSIKFSGYLVTAMGKDRIIDAEFMVNIQEKLFKFLQDNGERINEKDPLNIRIKQVEFEDWAIEKAEFLRKSVHNSHEVLMAFFPHPEVKTKFNTERMENTVPIKLSEIEAGKPVDFNVYVYLPTNRKFVLYTAPGGIFLESQKANLEKMGVDEVFVLKDQIQDFQKYKAENYLNKTIDDFQKKGPATETPAPDDDKKKAS